MGEFESSVPEQTVLYFNEQKGITLHRAATLADESALRHKDVFKRRDSSHGPSYQRPSGAYVPHADDAQADLKAEKPCFDFVCRWMPMVGLGVDGVGGLS